VPAPSAPTTTTSSSSTAPPANHSKPRARPVSTMEFTITRDPSTVTLQGPRGDPTAIVRSLQTSICQAFTGGPPPITLLSGRWSSQLHSNFVLTFSGQPSNNDILRFRHVLCSPFGPGASILPQCGYTHISIGFVPIIYDAQGNCPTSEALTAELKLNEAFRGLRVVSKPQWLRSSFEAHQSCSSVLISFLDEDGSCLPHITKNPVFMFGAPCIAKVFNSLPLIRQCTQCHKLGHSIKKCNLSANVIICPICGGRYASCNHVSKCPTANLHTDLNCHCPIKCINCISAHLPGKGHYTRDLACPLRKKYRHDTNRTGNSSTEELDRPMVVDQPIPPQTSIPSSQPTDNEQIIFKPISPKGKSAAHIDDSPTPPPKAAPPHLTAYLADMAKWNAVTDPSLFSTLSTDELRSISDYGDAKAYSLGVIIKDLIQSHTNV